MKKNILFSVYLLSLNLFATPQLLDLPDALALIKTIMERYEATVPGDTLISDSDCSLYNIQALECAKLKDIYRKPYEPDENFSVIETLLINSGMPKVIIDKIKERYDVIPLGCTLISDSDCVLLNLSIQACSELKDIFRKPSI